MAVKCGVVGREDACLGLVDLTQSLDQIINNQEDGGDSDTKVVLAEVTKKLEEIKERLKDAFDSKANAKETDIEEDVFAKNFQAQTPILAAIKKVSDWQKSLPPPPNIPRCYGSLPNSPTPSDQLVSNLYPLDLDSGCPGSDRSTLWMSYLQSKRMSPSSKSKSRENLGTPLYNLEEEKSPIAPPTQRQSPRSNKEEIPKHPPVAPKDIVTINNQFVSNITIEQGVKLTPRAESELKNIGTNQYKNIFRDQKELHKQLSSSGRQRNNVPTMTSTPIKQHAKMQTGRGCNSLPSSPKGSKLIRSKTVFNLRTASQPEDDFSQMTETLTAHNINEQHMTDLSYNELDLLENYQPSPDVARVPLGTPAKSCWNKTSSKCLFPVKGPQSQILAQEIDNEILELRNFFEDHREEMMTLLHGGGEQMETQNTSLPVFGKERQAECSQTRQKSISMMNINNMETKNDLKDEQYLESQRTTPNLPDPSDYPIFQETHMHALASREQTCDTYGRAGLHSSIKNWNARYDSESDVPDRTLLLRKKEFEKRRMKKEKQRRQFDSQGKVLRHCLPEFIQPTANNIQSFFPLGISNMKDPGEISDEEMLSSLPPILQQDKDVSRGKLYTDSFREAWTDTNESLVFKSPLKPAQSGSDTSHQNFVPRLNLSDLCSDITAPSQSFDYSFQSSVKSSNQLNIFQFQQKQKKTCSENFENKLHYSVSNRSIACDTLDLDQSMTQFPTSSRTTPGYHQATKNQSLPAFPRSSSLDQVQCHTSRLSRDCDNLGSNKELAKMALESVGLRASSPGPVIIINQTNCGQTCGQSSQREKSEYQNKSSKKKKKKKPSKVPKVKLFLHHKPFCFRICHLCWSPWMLQLCLLRS